MAIQKNAIFITNTLAGGSTLDNLAKFTLSFFAVILAHIPFWIYLLAKYAFSPEGFWQNMFLFGLGLFFLGFIQIVLWMFLIVGLVAIWDQ